MANDTTTAPAEIKIPEVTDADMVFGGAMKLMPAYADIPKDFQRLGGTPFNRAVSSLFFKGGKLSDHGIVPKPGADLTKIMRVLRACLGDYAPKHEHKEAGAAFLLSQWCDHKPQASA